MLIYNKPSLKYIILLIFLLLPFSVGADNSQQSSNKLHTVLTQIHRLEKHLVSDQLKQKKLQRELRKTEKNIGKIAKQLEDNQKQIEDTTKLLRKNRRKQADYQKQLVTQKKLLVNQMQAMYKLGRQPFLKIMLNQDDPEQIQRHLRYYEYFNQTRLENIHKIKAISFSLANTARDIQQQTEQLRKIRSQQLDKQQALNREKKYRKDLLMQTASNIQNKHQQLMQLREDKKRLEKVIYALKQQERIYGTSDQDFRQNHHKLPWPILGGRITQRYGQHLSSAQLRSTGVVIASVPGKEVHAVCAGKVVFADWLRGFGLMVIIQHSRNYMTLYGRNQSLYVRTDQMVQQGDTIATVGDSGGFEKSALYFEIRHKGLPVDPLEWLS
jgi:septal ring factor EnvC (AmiA/AmiB activator)